MQFLVRVFEFLGIPGLTLWALNHFQASASFAEAMSGGLLGLLVLWLMAWAIPDGASFADPSIEQRQKVFGRLGSSQDPEGSLARDATEE